jgi:hypothetical protein
MKEERKHERRQANAAERGDLAAVRREARNHKKLQTTAAATLEGCERIMSKTRNNSGAKRRPLHAGGRQGRKAVQGQPLALQRSLGPGVENWWLGHHAMDGKLTLRGGRMAAMDSVVA